MASSSDAMGPVLRGIYDAAFDPGRWSTAMEQVSDEIDARASFLFSSHSDTEPGAVQQTHGLPPEMIDSFGTYWHTQDEWANAARSTGNMQRGTLVTGTELVPARELRRTSFYNDFCRRYEIESLLGSVLFDGREADGMPLTNLCWYRPPGSPDFGEQEKRRVRNLLPHFRRALRIQRRIGWLASQRTQPALGALGLASFVLDRSARVVHHNALGGELLQSLPPECSRFGQLRQLGERCTPAITDAIAACRPEAPVQVMAMLGSPHHRVVQATLVVLPGETAMPFDAPPQARFLLLVELPRHGGIETAKRVAPLFGLTPAEARVLGGLLDGVAPAAIAEAGGTCLPTVRTQISNILAKTGTAGQSELLVLLRGLR